MGEGHSNTPKKDTIAMVYDNVKSLGLPMDNEFGVGPCNLPSFASPSRSGITVERW